MRPRREMWPVVCSRIAVAIALAVVSGSLVPRTADGQTSTRSRDQRYRCLTRDYSPLPTWSERTNGRAESKTSSRTAPQDCGDPSTYKCSFLIGAKTGNETGLGEASAPAAMVYNDVFDDACVFHDHCYRQGWVTYRLSREDCDSAFLAAMLEECDNFNWVELLDYPINLLETGGNIPSAIAMSIFECRQEAAIYYYGVRAIGSGSYHKWNGACCEFLWHWEGVRPVRNPSPYCDATRQTVVRSNASHQNSTAAQWLLWQ